MKKHNIAFICILFALIAAFAVCVVVFGTDLTKKQFTIKFEANGGICETESTIVKRGKQVEFPEISREHYEFDGWYNGRTKWNENKKVYHNYTLTAHWTALSYEITFVGTDSTETTQTIKYDASLPTEEERIGYEFGWYTEENGAGTHVTTVGEALDNAGKIYGYYKIITYTITLNLNGGEIAGDNPIEYTIETPTFTLAQPTRGTTTFLGWTGEEYAEPTTNVVIEQGTTGNKTFVANWESALISFVVDGKLLSESSIEVTKGDNVNTPEIDSSLYGLTYYRVKTWYSNQACTIPVSFPFTATTDKTLYGKWVYGISENIYSAFAKFDTATTSTSGAITINSYNELVLFVEYIQMNHITEHLQFKYSGTITNTTLEQLLSDSTYPSMSTNIGYVEHEQYKSIYLNTNTSSEEGTLDVSGAAEAKYIQKVNGINQAITTARSNDFDDFKINNVSKTISVSTSNALVYALEKGFKPVCVAGSVAETIYNKAKDVLREICDDTMTDVQKARAIYEWIIINTCYDHAAADNSEDETLPEPEYKYASWYAEGVFNKGLAVCDGICKAFVILARIEGIPCVRVTGNAHAWNKIYINGNWYEIDATHGDQPLSPNYEAVSYEFFLFTSNYRVSTYQTTDYSELVCETKYNFFDETNYPGFDLLIDNSTEWNALLMYVATIQGSNHKYSICVAITCGSSVFGVNTKYSLGTNEFGQSIYIVLIGE